MVLSGGDLKQQFVAKRGYWNDSWQFILEHDPAFFEGYARPGSAGSVRPTAGGAEELARLRQRHTELLGEVPPEAELGMRADPGFYARFLDLAAVSLGAHSALSAKEAHLIALAAYASVTQLCGPGVRQHIDAALRHGATPAEILEVCEQIAGMSMHSVTVGLPILYEELAAWRERPNTLSSTDVPHSDQQWGISSK